MGGAKETKMNKQKFLETEYAKHFKICEPDESDPLTEGDALPGYEAKFLAFLEPIDEAYEDTCPVLIDSDETPVVEYVAGRIFPIALEV